MNINKYIKRQIWGYSAMLALGLIALLCGYIWKFQSMNGVAIGFIPVGLGGLVIMFYSRYHPQISRNIQAEADERGMFIRSKSGQTAFWITYWWVFAFTIFAKPLEISMDQFSIFTLIFMGIIYFIFFFINLAKY